MVLLCYLPTVATIQASTSHVYFQTNLFRGSVIVKTDGSFAALVLTKQHVPVLGHDLGPEAGHHLEAGAAAVLGRENSCRKMGLLDYVK